MKPSMVARHAPEVREINQLRRRARPGVLAFAAARLTPGVKRPVRPVTLARQSFSALLFREESSVFRV